MGYAWAYRQECGVIEPGPVPLPTPTGEIDSALAVASAYWVFNVDSLLP